jgi:hypothetical protein
MLPIVVVGAGAAGVLAAIFAAGSGRRVLLLESTKDGGRKILISGGGRCNILPSDLDAGRFVTSSSPNSLRKILRSWPLEEQMRFFEEEAGIPLAIEAETGKLFPVSNSARAVRGTLFALARRRGVEMRYGARVTSVDPVGTVGSAGTASAGRARSGGARSRAAKVPAHRAPAAAAPAFSVKLDREGSLDAAAVVLATGGLSVPATGSDGAGIAIARQLGHTIHETYPALTPLVATPHPHAGLSGVSLRVRIEAPGTRDASEGGFLFTHRGWSGPAVLDLSHLAVRSRLSGKKRQELHVQWTDLGPDDWDRLLRDGRGGIPALLRRHLPERLADTLLAESGVPPARRLQELPRAERIRLVEILTRYRLPWTSDEGYRTAEVTGGGVALGEVRSHTMESRLVPGLFLCGEMLDAFGPIGGYNFAWAWVTGHAAGLGAAERVAGEESRA